MAARKGVMIEFHALGKSGKSRLSFRAPSRGLIGFQSDLKVRAADGALVNSAQDCVRVFLSLVHRHLTCIWLRLPCRCPLFRRTPEAPRP
jgi:predicted membrane GTPase involved in stress response